MYISVHIYTLLDKSLEYSSIPIIFPSVLKVPGLHWLTPATGATYRCLVQCNHVLGPAGLGAGAPWFVEARYVNFGGLHYKSKVLV